MKPDLRDRLANAVQVLTGRKAATADTAGLPVLTPLQPIDLRDAEAVGEVLEVAMKVGEVLLDSGTGAVDTEAQVRYVAATYGIDDVTVTVTYNAITVSVQRGRGLPPSTYIRTVSHRSLDYTRLSQVDTLVRRIGRGRIRPDQALTALESIMTAGHPYSRLVATGGWALMSGALTLLLGGRLGLAAVAFVTTAIIYVVNVRLGQLGLPYFFQQVVGGFLATLPAALIYKLSIGFGWDVEPYRVIVAGIIVLMAGLSLVGAVQDAITGAPVTGAARFFEVIVFTGGVVAGVGMALRVASQLGATLPPLRQEPFDYAPLPILVSTGGIAAAAFALAGYAQVRALIASFLAGCMGAFVSGSLLDAGLGPIVGSTVAATTVGLAGGLLARRAVVPPLIVAVAGITPLVPGLAVYRGLSELMEGQTTAALTNMATALTVGCALAAGVTLGEWVARTIRRPHISGIPFRRVRGQMEPRVN
ncbi:threonine/serine exporter ThrE family protein [Tsukamurella sp. 1534]|uniref:threonine/serine ThrE exporter family protein n=1 Tax=Tsukamurella sp. 1534 TaxID=1151061 RepID=UPI00030A4F7F|nr:threonine/serine exporter family protein [Tsukamurella sp. 1534]